ncbi:Dam family site-specific DNA-(adenine-N6)-methyltransferase [Candidatus Poseidoniales archaeon]|nr:Dam family site-specific DNA-(adenine-N6)-methyltransferase [Candidatus Poseidoniales archaeon]
MAKPFLKWAGGKRQLLDEISSRLPTGMEEYNTYVEPFVGGGAVLFHFLDKYEFDQVHIFDINPELTLCYEMLKTSAPKVWSKLKSMVKKYPPHDSNERSEEYYSIRTSWNKGVSKIHSMSETKKINRVAQTIFLNKTCFNGLFRVNSKGEFNVPIGSYKNPSFPSEQDLLEVQSALADVIIHLGSFEQCEELIDQNTFLYFDPPYRPLSETSHFVSYSKDQFDDEDQKKLAQFVQDVDQKGAKFILSNSDPKNTIEDDNFFDDLYDGFSIDRVLCNRAINSKASKRGPVTELLIGNCW